MIAALKSRAIATLRWSEKYTKTDMVYLAQGGFWLLVGQVGAIVFSLTLATVFGHFASKDLYGNYKYILSLAALVSVVSLSGIGTAMMQAVARGHDGALKQGVQLNLKFSLPMLLLSLFVALYYYLQGNLFVAISMCIVSVGYPLLSSFSLFDNFLIGRREFARSASYFVSSNFALLIGLVAVLFIGGRAIMLVAAYFAITVGTNAFFYFRTLKFARNNETDPGMLRYGFNLTVMGVIGSVANQIDSIVIFSMLGPANLAIYTYAIAMPEQMKNVLKNIVPLSMSKFAERSVAEIRATIWHRVMVLGIGTMIVALLYILIAPFLFRLLFPVYIGSVWYSQLYMVSLMLSFIAPFSTVFQAHKKTKELYIISNVPQIVLIITLPVLTAFYGITGAIVSQILYRATNAVLAMVLFQTMRE